MSSAHLALRGRRRISVLVLLFSLAAIMTSYAAPTGPAYASHEPGNLHDAVAVSSDGVLSLQPDAPSPPAVLADGRFSRYGSYVAAVETLVALTISVRVNYTSQTPAGTDVLLFVRGSSDGLRWSEWQPVTSPGSRITFAGTVDRLQYRAELFGTADAGPTLSKVSLEAPGQTADGNNQLAANATAAEPLSTVLSHQIAPTFRIRATRQGMIGGRTANGFIIPPRAHFVSLPSWSSLSPRGSWDYRVRISYRGRSVVAPVWDVGPWNTRDDYWATQRNGFPELPRGWPQDHAAYFDKHNGGYAEKGYVRFPTAIDVGDGIWWNELGIHGDQAEVEVTYLWLGRDPLAVEAAEVHPDTREITVNELSPLFKREGVGWNRSVVGCGEGEHAFWTVSTTDSEQVQSKAFWQPVLPAEGMYDLYVHVPICPSRYAPSEQARYLIEHRDGAVEVVVNQQEQTHWVHLGQFPFAAGDEGFIYLTDLAGDAGRSIWFDQARWVRADQ